MRSASRRNHSAVFAAGSSACMRAYHTPRMGTLVQIRDVPEPVHRKLKARAADRGTSLSEYLRQELERIAETPTTKELRERLARREPVHTSETAAETIRAIREHGE